MKRLVVGSWTPVNGDALQFRYDTGQVGMLVQPTQIGRGTKDLSDQAVPTEYGRAYFLTQWERRSLRCSQARGFSGRLDRTTNCRKYSRYRTEKLCLLDLEPHGNRPLLAD